MTHFTRWKTLATLTGLFAAAIATAQVKEPPRAAKVDIEIRYRIRTDRDERIRQYRLLEKHLKSLDFQDKFKDDPDRELDILDPKAERFTGTMPGTKALDVLRDQRVQTILFAPAGFMYPGAEEPVAVRIGIRSGLLPNAQQQLHSQTVSHLQHLGFVEVLGYDTGRYTVLRGSIPRRHIEMLVKDIRYEPAGWFVSETPPYQLPKLLAERNPIRWVEVLPVTDFPEPFKPFPVLGAQLLYSADLRAALADTTTKALRVEVVFRGPVTDPDQLRTRLIADYLGASLDGYIGNVATIYFPRVTDIDRFALEPGVMSIRLPRQGSETVATVIGGNGVAPAEAVKTARLDALHTRGYTGAGVKVVLITADVTGVAEKIGTELPKNTRIVDFTTELNPELKPGPPIPSRLGSGLVAARALAAAAPDAELVVVRIDPGCSFYQRTIIQLARGEMQYTDALQTRMAEITAKSQAIVRDKVAAIAAYKTAFADLGDDPTAVKNRAKAKADLDAVIKREKDLTVYAERFNEYHKQITTALRGAHVFVNTLVWESGYPLDSLSDFAGTLDILASAIQPRVIRRPGDPAAQPHPPVVWVQAASNAGPAVWGGPFLDANSDGRMEWTPHPRLQVPDYFPPLLATLATAAAEVQLGMVPWGDNWSQTINFLGTRAADGTTTADVPAKTKLRITVQWREPTDPNYTDIDVPVYPLTLRLWRQLDPAGEKLPSDEMLEVARSVSVPNIIYRSRTFIVFEQMVEYEVPTAGRFGLVIDAAGQAEPLLPTLRREVEIFPRVVVETLGAATNEPQVVFRSYTSVTAGVAVPGDSLGAVTVGIDVPGAQLGGGSGISLRVKPDVFGPEGLTFGPQTATGTGTATAFAGGAAVVLLQARAGAPTVIRVEGVFSTVGAVFEFLQVPSGLPNLFRASGIPPGAALVLPEGWVKTIPPAPKKRP